MKGDFYMNVLVACEESQRVCEQLRIRGHRAFSCDILECSGGHPFWHIQADVLPLLNGNCEFKTMDGEIHHIRGKWDMIIAFPPCTHLATSGARHFSEKRKDGRQAEGIEFFAQFLQADCDRIAIENPRGIISGNYILEHFPELCEKYNLPKEPTQIIQPYFFGDPYRKTTCLWLKGLPSLVPTNMVEPNIVTYIRNDGRKTTFSADYSNGGDRQRRRSKTYPGVAQAMAEQWTREGV